MQDSQSFDQQLYAAVSIQSRLWSTFTMQAYPMTGPEHGAGQSLLKDISTNLKYQ